MSNFYKIVRNISRKQEAAEYISDCLVEDNTKDPLTGKDMLQSYGQYNVGVMVVRFFQLYSLSKLYPDKYGHIKITKSLSYVNGGGMFKFELINKNTNRLLTLEDIPSSVTFTMIYDKPGQAIILDWHGRRKDKLTTLSLNEDTGVITAYFYGNNINIPKSSDGRVEYLTNGLKHRPEEEGPAVITAEGDREYWEHGEHIRTEGGGYYIKGVRR